MGSGPQIFVLQIPHKPDRRSATLGAKGHLAPLRTISPYSPDMGSGPQIFVLQIPHPLGIENPLSIRRNNWIADGINP